VKRTVLLVEDDPGYRRSLCRLLSISYKVILVQEGRTVIEEIAEHHPDLVILGHLEQCETIRAQWHNIAIMILSTESSEKRIVQALDWGADDYIVKPFSQEETEARIRAVLRRVPEPGRSLVQEPDRLQSADGYLSLNKPDHLAYVGESRVYFTPTEFAIVWQLLLHAGKVLTHRALLQAVWGPEYASEADYLRVYVRQIRRKIEVAPSKPRYILTEPGVGYVLRNPPS
jgi:two-component system, OmpR family, KDP operon response regulator KdpE